MGHAVSKFNSVHIHSILIEVHFNIVLPSSLRYRQQSFSSGLQAKMC